MSNEDKTPYDLGNSRNIRELIMAALAQDEEDKREQIIHELQNKQDSESVFLAAKELCASEEPQERALGAEILGFLGFPDRPFIKDSADILTRMISKENDSDVIYYIVDALRHLEDFRVIGNVEIHGRAPIYLKNYPAIIPHILPFVDHSDAEVRTVIVLALGAALLNTPGHEDKSAVKALIKLSADKDRNVRDWAVFELGAEHLTLVEWPEITEALLKRVSDEDAEVRSQALLGLARRHTAGTVELLIHELSWQLAQENISDYTLEAAYELADHSLCPVLCRFKDNFDSEWVEKALEACKCNTFRIRERKV
ncbi:MAG: HEAT repeat domain-containing protein [Armatimonadota bacterium]